MVLNYTNYIYNAAPRVHSIIVLYICTEKNFGFKAPDPKQEGSIINACVFHGLIREDKVKLLIGFTSALPSKDIT
ncbi:hypothetical protein MA16_Dca000177 [Dendrobium catenatum]|uniref:Uncharacterized protein n=1 Tax=Dendrobium catenatum TaxID=906689 RepID=A0A2I0WT49_9ASPA|nr:hypothetical protein MA16_Dca000177 [Dendrobium catenatum]